MSENNSGKNIILILLGVLWGLGIGLFMSRKPGKDLRKEVLKKWDDGEPLPKAKFDVFFREAIHAFKGVPDMLDEFLHTKRMEEYKEQGKEIYKKGKKVIDRKIKEGREIMDKKVEEGKKVVNKKVKKMKKEVKKQVKNLKK